MISDALHNVTVLEGEKAVFECTIMWGDDLGGQRFWFHKEPELWQLPVPLKQTKGK